MIKFEIITIFPQVFSYFNESIIKRAQEKKVVKINIHDLRDFTDDKRKTVDDRPYGGGAGMVIKLEPIFKAVGKIKSKVKSQKSRQKRGSPKRAVKVILFSVKGKKFNQETAKKLSKFNQLILICGRYEGVDERVAKHIADEEISIGDYILTGGEIPAMIVVDAVSRLIPGVIKEQSLIEESFSQIKNSKLKIKNSFFEYPQYTRPEIFEPKRGVKWRAPKVLLSGNHKKIEQWRKKHKKIID